MARKTKRETLITIKTVRVEGEITAYGSKSILHRKLTCYFLGFLMEISSYLHQEFEKEGFFSQFEDIEPYCYYFGDAISLFKNKETFAGQGLFVREDESYWKKELLGMEER